MVDLKTVDGAMKVTDPLSAKQKEDVAKMRASLLSCSGDSTDVVDTIQNITLLRVYHQISRIIRYLDMMDKLEDKLYQSIDSTLDKASPEDPATLLTLLRIQERLQKNMIESHKILEPYIDLSSQLEVLQPVIVEEIDETSGLLNQSSRDKVRVVAQNILNEIDNGKVS